MRLRTMVRHTGLYAADFFTVAPRLTLMGAARFNHSVVTLRDQAGTELDGDHSFSRLNPAVGLTYELPRASTAYGSFSMSSRVPAPSELSCADPGRSLPASECVRGRSSARAGRGQHVGGRHPRTAARAHVERVDLPDGQQRRHHVHQQRPADQHRPFRERGQHASAGHRARRVGTWSTPFAAASPTRSCARRFDTPLTLSSPNHPDEEDGEIEVEAGSRLPGVPQHNLKANLSATIKRLTLRRQPLDDVESVSARRRSESAARHRWVRRRELHGELRDRGTTSG